MMNATKEKVVFVLFVGTKKKKQTKKKDKKRREKKDLSEPLFALFCPIDIIRQTSILCNEITPQFTIK